MLIVLFVMAACVSLAPGRDHTELGGAIARAVLDEPALFRNDESKLKTASLLVAVAYRESSLKLDAVGDHGRSFCAYQIHESSGGTKALLTDADACVRKGLSMLRESMRICPAHPIAFYASGPGGCDNARAQRISRDRMAIAAKLVREVKP